MNTRSFARMIGDLGRNQYHRALTERSDYYAQVPRADIISELERGFADTDPYDVLPAMMSALTNVVDVTETLSIAQLVDQKDQMDRAMRTEPDSSLRAFGIRANLGTTGLIRYLTRRANNLARGIQPGATCALAEAFGLDAPRT